MGGLNCSPRVYNNIKENNMYCPKCGKVMKVKLLFDGTTKSGIRSYLCACGYATDKDRAGLRYSNIIDRYKLKTMES